MVFTSLSLRDIIKEFFRPKGLRSQRHGRKGRKFRRAPRGIPDPNEMIAKRLVENTAFNRRKYGMPTQIFYVVDDVIDRITWTVCLIEMADDLIYNTLIGVLEHEGEKCPNLGRLAMRGGYHVEGGAGPQWQSVGLGAVQYAIDIAHGGGAVIFMPDGSYSYSFGAKVIAPSHPLMLRLRLLRTGGGGGVLEMTDWIQVKENETTDIIIHATIEGPATVTLQAEHDGGFWDVAQSDLAVLEIL